MYPAAAMLMSFIGVAHLYRCANGSQSVHCCVLQKRVAKKRCRTTHNNAKYIAESELP